MKKQETRQGAASMYIVIFTTMLFSIISLSFVRIMLTESTQTINYSLSQSAYNSAMAGIEDAKIALLKYQNCISTNDAIDRSECTRIRQSLDGARRENQGEKIANEDCDAVSKALNRNTNNKETMVSSSYSKNNSNIGSQNRYIDETAAEIDQAYTCVIVNVNADDYISKLNNNNPSKFVPLRVDESKVDSIKKIAIRWYNRDDSGKANGVYRGLSNANQVKTRITDDSTIRSINSGIFSDDTAYKPPILRVDLFQAAKGFGLGQYYATYKNGSSLQANRGSLTLVPSTNGTNTIGDTTDAGFAASAMKGYNVPMNVKCDMSAFPYNGYACEAVIAVPTPIAHSYTIRTPIMETRYRYREWYGECTRWTGNGWRRRCAEFSEPSGDPVIKTYTSMQGTGIIYDNRNGISTKREYIGQIQVESGRYNTVTRNDSSRNQAMSLLRLNMPYGNPETTFEVVIYDNSNNVIPYSGVQTTIDSTGRANDLFRRVEARMEMVDTYFPIASAALTVTGTGTTNKNFYVTIGCFTQTTAFNGTTATAQPTTCADYKDL